MVEQMQPPPEDSFLSEVQALKRAVAEEFGYDIRRLGEHLMQAQRQSGARVVNLVEAERKAG